jgi:prepilin-type N-terminal cleavage/methylation domain-containing protein
VTILQRDNAEDGFTLIELVISMAVLAIIIVPVTGSMLFGLLETNGMRDRIADSSGAQIISSYFPSDIQSAGSDTSTGIDTSGNGHCSSIPGDATVRLRVTIPDATSPTTAAKETTVLYYTQPDPSTALKLTRRSCRTTPALDSSTIVVQHVDASSGFTPVCDPVATCKKVTVSLKTYNPKSASQGYSGKTFVLIGTRRISS